MIVELVANKFQELLGSNYDIIPMAKLQTEYTTAEQIQNGENIGYINTYNDKFTQLRANKIIGILNLQNPARANTDFYYITTNYTIEFSVPTNNTITKLVKSGNNVTSQTESRFNFFNDIETAINSIVDKKLTFGTKYGKMTISEPIWKGKETDGENEYAIFSVSGTIVVSDKANFGSDYKVEFLIGNQYVELDDINTYNENNDTENNAIIKNGEIKVIQNLSQSGWVATISIDDKISTNTARNLIYNIIHNNNVKINPNASTESLKYKQRVRITSPYGHIHLFDAIMTVSFGTTRNGVGSYNISLTDDNKGIVAYTLSFNYAGVESKTVLDKDFIGELPTPTRAGYDFVEWKIDNVSINENTIYTYGENKTATPVWSAKHYTLTIDSDGGSQIEPIDVEYGSSVQPVVTKDGYILDGWLIDGEVKNKRFTWNYTENKTATAIWIIDIQNTEWTFNEQLNLENIDDNVNVEIGFTSNNTNYTKITVKPLVLISPQNKLRYSVSLSTYDDVYSSNVWQNENYKTITFNNFIEYDRVDYKKFINWLQLNAEKVE